MVNKMKSLGTEKSTFREIESEGRLVCAKVVDMKNEVLRQVIFGPPNNPTNSGVDKPIFVATNVDALH